MPRSVASAVPLTVLPQSLCSAFARTEEWPIAINTYRDAEAQRVNLAASARLSWHLSRKLTASQLVTLLAFWHARDGALQAFYFYDPLETSPMFSHDPTGAEPTGRYTVRFDGTLEITSGIVRSVVGLRLLQLA